MRRVILAGCGHAHLEVVRQAGRLRAAGADVILVDPGRFWYSGLGSALLGGRCSEDEASIDPAHLAKAAGIRFRRDALVGIDRPAREVLLGSGARIAYDILSLNVGSHVPAPQGFEGAEAVKPIGTLAARRERIVEAGGGHVVVVGGGASGCELAGNLLHLGRTRRLDLKVTLVTAGDRLLATAPRRVGAWAAESLIGRGATVRLGEAGSHLRGTHLHLGSGEVLAVDHLMLATGLAPQPLVHRLGLAVRAQGLRVAPTLASIDDDDIFAAGDCAAVEGFALPKVGVYGVRAGPVLLRNILARLEGRGPEVFRPQARYLSILDLADGRGIATRGTLRTRGRLALGLKHHLDRSFVDRYRQFAAT